jgi:hypothetical protein
MNLDTFVDRLRIETTHLSGTADPGSVAFRKQLAIILATWIPVYLSSGLYSSLLASGTPPSGLMQTLDSGAGICGHHVELAANSLESLGVEWRDVQVFYEIDGDPRNHTVVEAEWGDLWRMIDVTWGFIPHRGSLESALSWESAAAASHRDGFHNRSLPWRVNVERQDEDIFSYLDSNADLVLYSGSGDYTIPIRPGKARLRHNRVVRTGLWNHLLGMTSAGTIRLNVEKGWFTVRMNTLANHPGTLHLDDFSISIEPGNQVLELILEGPREYQLEFRPDGGVGSVSIESAETRSIVGETPTDPSVESIR